MTLQELIERQEAQIADLEETSADVRHLAALRNGLAAMFQVKMMLDEADTLQAKPSKAKRAKAPRKGSLAHSIIDVLQNAHAYGMSLDEINNVLPHVQPLILKRAISPHLNTTFEYDFVSGLYSLKSRAAERENGVSVINLGAIDNV